jgi:HTH-like domain
MLCSRVYWEQKDVVAFLREENRVLKAQLRGRRLRLSDHDRRRFAAIGRRLGRRALADVATIATPGRILRWHRELVVRERTDVGRRAGRPGVPAHIRSLVVRMATENATWGYTRIQCALKNLGYRAGRSTVARILKQHGVPPSGRRPMTWRTFARAHWPALLEFVTTEASAIRAVVILYAGSVFRPPACRGHQVVSAPLDAEFLLPGHTTTEESRHWRAPTRVVA